MFCSSIQGKLSVAGEIDDFIKLVARKYAEFKDKHPTVSADGSLEQTELVKSLDQHYVDLLDEL